MEDLFGLIITIESVEDTSMANGEDAFIIYLKIDNTTAKSKKIDLQKATYVTSEREQLEQDIWLSGYISGEATLKADSFSTAGLVFYRSRLKKISSDDLLYITFDLPKEGKQVSICFKMHADSWSQIDKEQSDIEIKLTRRQLEKQLLKKVERLEAFEEKCGIYFENTSIKITDDDNWFCLYTELHSSSGSTIDNSISVDCIFYDSDGLIINNISHHIQKENFFGFEVFSFYYQDDPLQTKLNKIRMFPKIW